MKQLMVVAAVFVAVVSTANADIVGTTGDFVVFSAATANYNGNPYNDPTPAPIRLWIERQPITLASNVVLDTDLANSSLRYVTGSAGAGETAFAAGGGPTIVAGTLVNVYFAYFDPFSDNALGTVTFDMPVLGIVAHTSRLQHSDFLRVPGAPYPANPAFSARGWEDTEYGQLSADRRTLTFFGSASSPGDQFRIFTSAVPEPGSLSLTVAALGAFVLFLKRRH